MPLGIGQYPPEFNPKIHGPYNPGTYYGKRTYNKHSIISQCRQEILPGLRQRPVAATSRPFLNDGPHDCSVIAVIDQLLRLIRKDDELLH